MATQSSKARRWNQVRSRQVLAAVAIALVIAIPFFIFASSFVGNESVRGGDPAGGGSSKLFGGGLNGGSEGGVDVPYLRGLALSLDGDDSRILVCSGPPTKGLLMVRDPTQRALSRIKSQDPSSLQGESLIRDVVTKLQTCYKLVADIDFRLRRTKGDRVLAHTIDECFEEASQSDLHQAIFDAVYLPQLLRYYEVFGVDDLLILRAEDLEAKPREVLSLSEETMAPCRYSFQHKPLKIPDQDLTQQEGYMQLYEALIPWNLKLYDYLGRDLEYPRYEEAMVRTLISSNAVVIFSKSYCGYSRRAKNIILDQLKVNAVVMELDLHPRGAAIQSYLGKLTSRRTVPNVFIGGKSIGGGDETSAALANGKLQQWLIAVKALPEPEKPKAASDDPPSPEKTKGSADGERREQGEGWKPDIVDEGMEEEDLGEGGQQLEEEEQDKEEAPPHPPPPLDEGRKWGQKAAESRDGREEEKPL